MQFDGAERRRKPRRVAAIPVKIRLTGNDQPKQLPIAACTLDIAGPGARLSLPGVKLEVGQFITIERGKDRAMFEVVWVGDAESPKKGQVGVRCIETERNLWEDVEGKSLSKTDSGQDLLRALLKR